MNTARLGDVIQAVGPDFHGLSYRERLIVRAVLKHLFTQPADDVREALTKRLADEIEYRVRTAVALAKGGHSIAAQVTDGRASVPVILAQFEVSPRGTVTDADVPDISGFEGTHAAVDGLSIRGGESS